MKTEIKKLKAPATAILLVACSSVFAETVTTTALACKTEETWAEGMKYLRDGNKDGVLQLGMAGECTLLSPGDTVAVIDKGRSWGEVAVIRYKGVRLFIHRLLLR